MKAKKLLLTLFGLGLGAVLAQPVAAAVPVAEDDSLVTVTVVNRNWNAMRVYAVIEGVSHRLGTVSGLSEQRVRLRPAWVGSAAEIEIVAVPIGRRGATITQRMLIFPGDELVYRIESNLGLSNLSRL
ncbi:MAG: hypothetical protein O7I93_16180 [Gemmatimonadetes bacterium]|nr:hypothetical protein [Gemmatimonadota bacterium]